MKLRFRVLMIVLLTACIPLAVTFYAMSRSGFKFALDASSKDQVRKTEALRDDLSRSIKNQCEYLDGLMCTDGKIGMVAASSMEPPKKGGMPELYQQLTPDQREKFLKEWEGLRGMNDPKLVWLNNHPLTMNFQGRFRDREPRYRHFLLTNRDGVLIAGSYMPETPFIVEEEWWQTINNERGSEILIRIMPGEGAETGQVEILKKLVEDNLLLGYLRIELDLQEMVASYVNSPHAAVAEGLIVSGDGKVLHAFNEDFVEMYERDVATRVMLELSSQKEYHGASRESGDEGDEYLVCAARVSFDEGSYALGVIVLQNQSAFLSELKQKHAVQLCWVIGLIVSCAVVGMIYLQRTVSTPIEQLRRISRAVTDLSRKKILTSKHEADAVVEPLSAIQTGDEIEGLSVEFQTMAREVLGFQRLLDAEVVAKTKMIKDDLEMAKEFQQALMPKGSGGTKCQNTSDPLMLSFGQYYKPAAQVGGDFFDLVEIDDHRLGVFIADVMGHGARSALVTAILKVIVEGEGKREADPGVFLQNVNQKFSAIIAHSGQTIFATAAYLVFDAEHGVVHFSKAGHPHVLVYRTRDEKVLRLFPSEAKGTMPLGLKAEYAQYQSWKAKLESGDMYLLYTDGVIEAENLNGESFGLEQLRRSLKKHQTERVVDCVQKIALDTMRFANQELDDDICLLALRVVAKLDELPPADTQQSDVSSEAGVI